MIRKPWHPAVRSILVMTGAAALLLASGCGGGSGGVSDGGVVSAGGQSASSQTPLAVSAGSTLNTAVNKDGLPLRGKPQTSTPPAKAVFGMIYHNTGDGREYIYDGAQWVPH